MKVFIAPGAFDGLKRKSFVECVKYWSSPRNIVHRIKYKLSEAYRISVGVGLTAIRSEREMSALVKFCKCYLSDKEHAKLNPDRAELYRATIKLWEYEHDDHHSKLTIRKDGSVKVVGVRYVKLKSKHLNAGSALRRKQGYGNIHELIDDHVGWYWN